MAYDYHIVLGASSVLLGLLGYAIYFRSIFYGKTKPHVLTWSTYFLIDTIVFLAQVLKGAGPGAWGTLTGAVGGLFVSIIALRRGERYITKLDWTSFIGALFAIVLWQATSNPFVAVVIATIINVFAIFPTLRKSYDNPFEESISIWLLDLIRYGISIIALVAVNWTTVLFPIGLVATNAILVSTILIRRHILARNADNI
ncbi:MAG: hypothetical protein AAB830_00455 [Patescibacteria group bacterium]